MRKVSTQPNEKRSGFAALAGQRAIKRRLLPKQLSNGRSLRHNQNLLSGERDMLLRHFLCGILDIKDRKGEVAAACALNETLAEIGFRYPVEVVPSPKGDDLLRAQLGASVAVGRFMRAIQDAFNGGCTQQEFIEVLMAHEDVRVECYQVKHAARLMLVETDCVAN